MSAGRTSWTMAGLIARGAAWKKDADEDDITELLDFARGRRLKGSRMHQLLTGTPGVGKSCAAARLQASLSGLH